MWIDISAFFTHECEALKMKKIMDFLRNEGISPELIQEVQEFSAVHPVKPWQHFCVERIYCLQVKKLQEKMYWQKIWQLFSVVLHGISHFTSIWMHLRLSVRILSETGGLSSDQGRYTAVRAVAVLESWMRSIWQEMKLLQFCILHWISDGS